MTNEQKTEAPEHGVLGGDGIFRTFDEHYDNMQDVEQDPYGAWLAIQHLSQQNQAAIGAAIKRCAEFFRDKQIAIVSDENLNVTERVFDTFSYVEEIILATAPEAVKAFEEHEARHKAEREAVLRKAVAVIDDPDFTQEDVDYVDNAHKWVLLEEAQTAILALIPPDDLTALEKDRKATEAAALKEAASLVPSGSDEWFDNLRPVHWKRMMAVLRKEILALIPPDDLTALEARTDLANAAVGAAVRACAEAILHDHTKPDDNRLWGDERPYICEESAYRTILALEPDAQQALIAATEGEK